MATLESVSRDIMKQLIGTSLVSRAVASDLTTLTRVRIFSNGIASNGSKIGTYTPNTVSIKKSKGRFSSINVNFVDTGKLQSSYLFDCKGNKCKIGFANVSRGDGKTNKQLVAELQEKYGEVFPLTAKENKEIDNIIGDFLDRIYK